MEGFHDHLVLCLAGLVLPWLPASDFFLSLESGSSQTDPSRRRHSAISLDHKLFLDDDLPAGASKQNFFSSLTFEKLFQQGVMQRLCDHS